MRRGVNGKGGKKKIRKEKSRRGNLRGYRKASGIRLDCKVVGEKWAVLAPTRPRKKNKGRRT